MSAFQDALGMGYEGHSGSPAEAPRKKGWGIMTVAILGLAVWLIYSLLTPTQGCKVNPVNHKVKVAWKDVQISLGHFRTEYGTFPVEGPYARKDVSLRSEGSIVAALIAEAPELNPRGIKFLDMPMARDGKFGLLKESGQWKMLDPWGEMYYMALNVNMDNRIANPEAKPGNLSDKIPAAVNASVILYSSGPDRDPKTWEDNVRSWR